MFGIHFFTLAHNALPFLEYHLPVFKSLPMPWQWSISEGVTPVPAEWKRGEIAADMHAEGVSNDGTHTYLKRLAEHQNVRVTFDPFVYLTERCDRMLTAAKSESVPVLAWQVDADEFWTADQIVTMAQMFEAQPEKRAARFFCRFWVGPDKHIQIEPGAGNMPWDWWRVWRWQPGCRYTQHDPPVVTWPDSSHRRQSGYGASATDLSDPSRVFSREETRAAGLVFDHMAFVLPEQVKFKARRYGFNLMEKWTALQNFDHIARVEDWLPQLGTGVIIQRGQDS